LSTKISIQRRLTIAYKQYKNNICVIVFLRLVNGIIEFDEKCALLSTYLSVQQRFLSKKFLNTVYISLLIYFVGFELYSHYLWTPKTISIHITIRYLFNAPFFIDFAVLIASCFFLINLNNRFQTLIDFLKFLPVESDFPNEWTNSEIAMSMEKIRLLHSELSEQLKIFSLSYGPLLLSFFVFNFINLIFQLFLSICFKVPPSDVPPLKTFLRNTIPLILNIQIVVFTMSIIVAVSLIHDKVSYKTIYLINNNTSTLYSIIKDIMFSRGKIHPFVS